MAKRYNKDKRRRGDTNIDEADMDLFSRDCEFYLESCSEGLTGFVAGISKVRRRLNASTKRLDEKLDAIKDKVIGGDDSLLEDVDHNALQSDVSSKPQKADEPNALIGDPSRRSSSKVTIDSKEESENTSFPVFDPAAPAVEDSDSSDDEEDDGDHAFDHPSTYVNQPWIWLPKDSLGLSELLVGELKEAGIDASDVGATMDEEGMVEVSRNPPDEEWSGGHDL